MLCKPHFSIVLRNAHLYATILTKITIKPVAQSVAARYGVLKRDAGIALRGLYIINPEGVVEHITMNNFPIGRNVDEAKRTLQAIQYVAEHGEVCPANWQPGSATMQADPEKSLEYFASADAVRSVAGFCEGWMRDEHGACTSLPVSHASDVSPPPRLLSVQGRG